MNTSPPQPDRPSVGSEESGRALADPPGVTGSLGIGDVLVGVVTAIFVILVSVGVGVAIFGTEGLSASISLLVTFYGSLLIVTYSFARRAIARAGGSGGVLRLLGLRRFRLSDLKAVLLAYAIYWALAIAISLLADPAQEDVTQDLGFDDGRAGQIVAAIGIIVAAPVVEETFFRGFVFGGLRSKLPFVVAAVISALLFGIAHFSPDNANAAASIQLAAFGALLAWLYERTGSLWPAIIMHLINNTIAFVILTS